MKRDKKEGNQKGPRADEGQKMNKNEPYVTL